MTTDILEPINFVVDGITVIYDVPPVWESVLKAFQIAPVKAVFTYGNKIYNPSGVYLPDHIIHHEKVHVKQQAAAGGPELWWGKFLRDKDFRLDQESEAYARQYEFVCNQQKDRNVRHNFLLNLSRVLAGPIYGNIIDINGAMKLIKSRANVQ